MKPELTIGKLSDFVPQRKNANRHTPRGMGLLDEAMTEDGYVAPMTATADGEVIDGSARLETAVTAFPDEAVIVDHDGQRPIIMRRIDIPVATDQRAKRISLRANRIAQINLDFSPIVLESLSTELDLSHLWTPEELSTALIESSGSENGALVEDVEPKIDKAEELREKWGVESGQLWQLGEHRLLCGDSTKREDVERVMGGEKVTCVLTDPPYGQNQPGVPYDSPDELVQIVNGAVQNLPVSNSIIVAFQSPRTFPEWLDCIRKNGHSFQRMLWLYKAAQCTFPWRGWILKSESILISTVGSPMWNEVHPFVHDCYYLSEVSGELPEDMQHGAVKPLIVVKDLLLRTSQVFAVVYDPFLGSGTTLIACEQLNRKCRAIEISPGYVAVTLERYQQATQKTPTLL